MAQLSVLVLGATALGATVAWAQSAPDGPIDIGSRLELFVDYYLIDELKGGAELEMHHPQLQPTPPDAQPQSTWATILKDGDTYQMLVRALKDPKVSWKTHGLDEHFLNHILLYYESRDGIHWTAPDLGLHDVPRFPEGNVVMADEFGVEQTFAAFVDGRPGIAADQRYKGLGGKGYPDRVPQEFLKRYGRPGLRAYASPDGVHWKKMQDEPVIPGEWGAFDSQNVVFWSPSEQRYVCYFRVFDNAYNTSRVRSVKRTTSTDFLSWSEPVDVQINLPGEHLYTTGMHPYWRAPHIYIATPTRFLPKRRSSTDVLFMSTRDGIHFNRPINDAFIRPGLNPKNWGNRSNYTGYHVVPTSDTEMSIYMSGCRRYTLRTDGFISVNAPQEGGELISKPLTFDGQKLVINSSTSAGGQIKVELQDASGKPIDGYSLDEAGPIIGDKIEQAVSWRGSSDVSRLAGEPVCLRFVMEDADLYSIRFQ